MDLKDKTTLITGGGTGVGLSSPNSSTPTGTPS